MREGMRGRKEGGKERGEGGEMAGGRVQRRRNHGAITVHGLMEGVCVPLKICGENFYKWSQIHKIHKICESINSPSKSFSLYCTHHGTVHSFSSPNTAHHTAGQDDAHH